MGFVASVAGTYAHTSSNCHMHTCTHIKNSLYRYVLYIRDARSIRHVSVRTLNSAYMLASYWNRDLPREAFNRDLRSTKEKGGGVDMPRAQRYRGICVRREMTADQLRTAVTKKWHLLSPDEHAAWKSAARGSSDLIIISSRY